MVAQSALQKYDVKFRILGEKPTNDNPKPVHTASPYACSPEQAEVEAIAFLTRVKEIKKEDHEFIVDIEVTLHVPVPVEPLPL